MKVTVASYRAAALEQVSIAQELQDEGHYVLANYLAGLAVECMLRAYCLRVDASFEPRHDIRDLYKRSHLDIVIPDDLRATVDAALGTVVTQWTNSQRYYSLELLRADFKKTGADRGVKGNVVKELTRRTVNAALEIVTLGERQWKHSLKK